MAQIKETLTEGKMIPFFNLPSTKGKSIKPWDYKQRKNLVIYVFAGAECRDCRQTLKEFAENYPAYRRANAEVLAVGTDSLENLGRLVDELNLPFPVLADEDAEVASKYTSVDPNTKKPASAIFVTDRFGSLEEEWIVGREDQLPSHKNMLSLIELFELRCPE